MTMQIWQPIETAPKNQRILLFYKKAFFTGINIIIGNWDDGDNRKLSDPYWTNDLVLLKGVRETKNNQPSHWMPLPEVRD